jgi:hypothetical protein
LNGRSLKSDDSAFIVNRYQHLALATFTVLVNNKEMIALLDNPSSTDQLL